MSDLVGTAVSIIGWAGALVSVIAYALVTQGRIAPSSLAYQGMNIGGAGALAVSASVNSAWPSAVVNVVWVAIGIQAVLSLKRSAVAGRVRSHLARRGAGAGHGRGAADVAHPPADGTRPGGSTRPSSRAARLARPGRVTRPERTPSPVR